MLQMSTANGEFNKMTTIPLASLGGLEQFLRVLIAFRAGQHGENVRDMDRAARRLCRMGMIKRGSKG